MATAAVETSVVTPELTTTIPAVVPVPVMATSGPAPAPATESALAPEAPITVNKAPALAMLLSDGTTSTWRDNMRCGLLTAGFLLVCALMCGVAGSFTTLAGGSVSSTYTSPTGDFAATTVLNTTTLFFCESVSTCSSPVADAGVFCSAMNTAIPNGCYSVANSSPISGWSALGSFFGSSQLRAGLAFAIIAWLFDVMALLLFALAIVEIVQVPGVLSRGGLATCSRLPSVMAVIVVSTVMRIVALGCAVNFCFVAFGNTSIATSFTSYISSPPSTVLAAYTSTGSTWAGPWIMTGSILLFVALTLQVVAFFSLWITVNYARALDTTATPAAAPRVSAKASAV